MTYSKGDTVLYKTNDGNFVPSKIISVDSSIDPPSYSIKLNGSLNQRETEGWRLAPLGAAGALPPAAQNAAAADWGGFEGAGEGEDDDNFGDFSAAPVTPAAQSPPSSPKRDFLPAGVASPYPEDRFHEFLRKAAPHAAQQIEQEEETEDYQDFAAAAPPSPVPEPPHAAHNYPAIEPNGSSDILSGLLERKDGAAAAAEIMNTANGTTSAGAASWGESDDDGFGDFAAAEENGSGTSLRREQERPAGAATINGTAQLSSSTINEAWSPVYKDASSFSSPRSPPPPLPTSPLFNKLGRAARTASLLQQQRASPRAANAGPAAAPSVEEYGVAWTLLLFAAAERLEAGARGWVGAAPSVQRRLLGLPQAQSYFASLGRVYFVAGAVRLACDALGLLRMVTELQQAWERCERAWETPAAAAADNTAENGEEADRELDATSELGDGSMVDLPATLREVVLEAAAALELPLQSELELVPRAAAALGGMSMDEFPRMLAWSEGQDSLTLLPLAAFVGGAAEVPTVAWPSEERTTLAPLANFWLGCVSSVPPELE